MFYDALTKWTEAEFYFVASYKTIPETVNEKDMSLYYAQAKALCEIYGIHFIDLYNDTELYNTFDYENTELFVDDKFTPTNTTYDLLSASVVRLFNASLSEKLVNPFAETQQEDDTDTLPPVVKPVPKKTSRYMCRFISVMRSIIGYFIKPQCAIMLIASTSLAFLFLKPN